jgi:hypothetical protein
MARRTLMSLAAALVVVAAAGPASGANLLPVWGTVPSPNHGDLANALAGVSALAPDDVWAVGEYNPGVVPTVTGRRTLAEHWAGTEFVIAPTPNASWDADLSTLTDVAGVASSDVWAVGYAEDFSTLRSTTLIEHWDGASWSRVRSPNPAGSSLPNRLLGVAAISSTSVWAVGESGYPEKGLILHWNGSAWGVVPNACKVPLQAITAVSPTELWAVGPSTTCHYDGTRWSVVPSPKPRSRFSEIGYALQDVSGSSPTDLWAVGYREIEQGESIVDAPLAEHWDGSRWTRDTSLPGLEFYGVSALAPDDAWAVGNGYGPQLILHWDGQGWTTVPTPSPGAGQLSAIDASSPTDLWAVGGYSDGASSQRTLVENAPSKTQGTVTGQTGVAGSVVAWFGPVDGATEADVFGHYSAPGLPAGTYLFVASAGGCTPDSAQVTVVAGVTTVQDLQLTC